MRSAPSIKHQHSGSAPPFIPSQNSIDASLHGWALFFLSQHLVEMSILVFRFCNFVFMCAICKNYGMKLCFSRLMFMFMLPLILPLIISSIHHCCHHHLLSLTASIPHQSNISTFYVHHLQLLTAPPSSMPCEYTLVSCNDAFSHMLLLLFFYLISFLFTYCSLCFHLHIISTR